jgi:hypothetical protein
MKEMFVAAAVGLLLCLIGAWVPVRALMLIGVFIVPLAVLWGAIFKTHESQAVKITLLAVGGLLLTAAVQILG